MLIKTNGIVLKQRPIGESDRIITILSNELGLIEANIKMVKSKPTFAGILTYAEFVLFKSKNGYYVNTICSIESFYSIRLSVEKLSLASYFCELTFWLCKSVQNVSATANLLVNTLYFLQTDRMPMLLIKAIFELRLISILGFTPNLIGCRDCIIYEHNIMYFFPIDGCIICGDCLDSNNSSLHYQLHPSILKAMRYIIFCDDNKLFSFKLSNEAINNLSFLTETYVLLHIDMNFKPLDMFKELLK